MNKFIKFMYGRYGVDKLSLFLLRIYFILLILNIFLRVSWLSYIGLFLLCLICYRTFSKKIYKRSDENVKFLKLEKKIIGLFNKNGKRDKDHVYRKCLKCHTVLKLPLPYNRGMKIVKCPKCGKRNKILVFRKQKIEVIKKKK